MAVRTSAPRRLVRWLGIALLFGAVLAAMPAAALNPARSIAQFVHTRWTIEDGAPLGIENIAQSGDGFLWLGTSSGLYRFDGVTFEPMSPEGGATGGTWVVALYGTRSGDVWIAYRDGRMARYRAGRLRIMPSSPKQIVIRSMAEDAQGGIWVTSQDRSQLVSRFAGGRWISFGAGEGVPEDGLALGAAAGDGSLWVGLRHRLLTMKPGTGRFVDSGVKVGNLAIPIADQQRRMWVLDDAGLRRVDGAGPAPVDPVVLPPNEAKNTLFDRDGVVWAAAEKGIVRITGAGGPARDRGVERYTAREGLSSDQSSVMFEDREGNIWVGTSLGLDRFRAANIVVETGVPAASPMGYVLFGGPDGIIHVGDTDSFYRVEPGGRPERERTVSNPQIICQDGQKPVWFGSDGLLEQGEKGSFRPVTLPDKSLRFWSCAIDRAGSLWVETTKQRGLGRVENGALKLGYLVPSNGESNYAKTIGIDPSGHVVLGLERGDFLAFDPAQPDRKWAIKAASPFRAHTAWFDRGSLLFGGTQGLVRVAGNRLQQIDAAGHPWLSEVSGIVRTPRGETWMIGAKGVVRTRSADIDAAFDRPGQPLPMELLDIRDGLPGPMQFGQREAALGGDGRVWFLTTQGVAWVDPAHMAVNRVMPPVVIRSILAGGRRYAAEDGLRLPKGTSRIQIDYTALSLSIPERVRFLYRLEGVDSDWVDPGARRQVFYTNLAPGHYRFQVIAANNDGVWNRTGASVAFEILPYFWQTWWFALLCVLASVACLAFLYRLRMRQVASRLRERLEERLEERERIARELHDTLLQSVQGLLLHFHSVADRIPPNEPTRGLMERTLERADDILIEGRERVRGLRFSEDGEDLPQVLHEIVARAALAIPVRVRIEGEPGAVHPLVVEEISRIGSEALFNIGRHAAASSAEIRLAFDPRHLSVSFSDDGVGIAREVLDAGGREGHFGLPGMRERVAKLRGEFRVQSRPGVGTEIRLTIPARTAYARSRWLWASRLFGLFGRKG